MIKGAADDSAQKGMKLVYSIDLALCISDKSIWIILKRTQFPKMMDGGGKKTMYRERTTYGDALIYASRKTSSRFFELLSELNGNILQIFTHLSDIRGLFDCDMGS